MFRRLAPFPLVLGCSRPLVGVDTESSEVVQETLHSLFSLPPHAARAPHEFSKHHALRPSCVLHARQKSCEQDPPPAHNRLDAFTSCLHEGVLTGNWVAGAIVISPTDVRSQEAVVGSAQRAAVARAQASHDAAVQHCLSTSAFSIRTLSSTGALGRSYSSRVYFRKLHHALRLRRSTSMDRLVLQFTFSPRHTSSFVWMNTWPAASTLKPVVDSSIPFARKHMISVLVYDTERPNAAHAHHLPELLAGDCETTLASSGESMPQSDTARAGSPAVTSPAPVFFRRLTPSQTARPKETSKDPPDHQSSQSALVSRNPTAVFFTRTWY